MARAKKSLPFFTVGHSTRTAAEFVAILQGAGVELLVDVRSIPRSRRNPQFNIETLPKTLKKHSIGYIHIPDLGGLRKNSAAPPETNAFWELASFRNYADYALTEDFHRGFMELCALGAEQYCAVMCAEAVWWRCHRRIITDHLLAAGKEVFHIMGLNNVQPAQMTEGAAVSRKGVVTYPGIDASQ